MNDKAFRAGLAVPAVVYGLFMLVPLLALLANVSRPSLKMAICCPDLFGAILLSLASASVATLLAVLGGLPLAWLLVTRPSRLGRALAATFELPMVLPPAVAGLALILAFGRYQLLGPGLAKLGIEQVPLTRAAVVMAQVLVASPLFFRAARVALEGVPVRFRHASAVLGAGEATTFWQVVLPLARRGLLAGALMTWSRALGELGATLMFAGSLSGRTLTMPAAIFVSWETELSQAVALALLLLAMAVPVSLAARRLAGGTV